MIRLTIDPLIAASSDRKINPMARRDDDSGGKSRETCSLLFLGTRRPPRKVDAVWTLVAKGAAPGRPSAPSEAGVEHPAGRDLAPDRAALVGADARLVQLESADHDTPLIAVQGAGHGHIAPREHVLAVEGLPRRQGRPQLAAPAEEARSISQHRRDPRPATLRRPLIGAEAQPTLTARTMAVAEKRVVMVRMIMSASEASYTRKHFPLARRRGCMQSLAGQGGMR